MAKQSEIVRHIVSLQELARKIEGVTKVKPHTRVAKKTLAQQIAEAKPGDTFLVHPKKKKPRVTQQHHISYQPEWTVPIYKGEHWCLTQMQRRVNVSVGFLTALKVFIVQHEYGAHDLEAITEIK